MSDLNLSKMYVSRNRIRSIGLITCVQFNDAGLHPIMRENIRLCHYDYPTPIQAYSIPAVLTGHDLIAIAQTGKLSLSILLDIQLKAQDLEKLRRF